jgi:predicted HTH transcriptional regulator
MSESNRIEYKRELTDTLEREAVAFLNYRDGGVIYVGVDDQGQALGLAHADRQQLEIKDRLKNNIQPSTLGLFDVLLERRQDREIVKVTLASGPEKPYYLKKRGMTEKGCYLRIGSATEPMPIAMIESLFARRTRNSIGKIRAPRQDLTFEQLKIYYNEAGYDLNDQFAANLELQTESGEYNYAAYLLADRNGLSVKVAKYRGTDRVDLIENNEYGFCSLVKATKQVLDRLAVENRTLTRITPRERIDQPLINPIALREAVVNAIVHNEYSNEVPPKFELFADRLEITSAGGLPQGLNQTEFFQGFSVPRNKEIMRVFKDLELVEYLGSGLPRILKAYPPEVFSFSENFLRMVFPFEAVVDLSLREDEHEAREKAREKTREKTREKLIYALQENPTLTAEELAVLLSITPKGVEWQLSRLKSEGVLRRVGPAKGGHWQVVVE